MDAIETKREVVLAFSLEVCSKQREVNQLYFRKPGQGKTFPKGWLHIECF